MFVALVIHHLLRIRSIIFLSLAYLAIPMFLRFISSNLSTSTDRSWY